MFGKGFIASLFGKGLVEIQDSEADRAPSGVIDRVELLVTFGFTRREELFRLSGCAENLARTRSNPDRSTCFSSARAALAPARAGKRDPDAGRFGTC